MTLLEQETTKKRQVNKLLELESEFNVGKYKEYKVEVIKNSATYTKVVEYQLSGLYYLISWNNYSKNESIWELVSAIMYL